MEPTAYSSRFRAGTASPEPWVQELLRLTTLNTTWMKKALQATIDWNSDSVLVGRNEFARISYLFAQLLCRPDQRVTHRSNLVVPPGWGAGLGIFDKALFLPLDRHNLIGCHLSGSFEEMEVFETSELEGASWPLAEEQIDALFDEESGGQVSTAFSNLSGPSADIQCALASIEASCLKELLEIWWEIDPCISAAGAAENECAQVVVLRQRVNDCPHCLILLLSDPSRGKPTINTLWRLEALVRMFFESYRAVRLEEFNEAYRALVDRRLLLQDFAAGLKDVPEGHWNHDKMAQFLYFFCQSLRTANALPEMDHAFFFPLVGTSSYLYQVAPPGSQQGTPARLKLGRLQLGGRFSKRSFREDVQGVPGHAAKLCRRLFIERLNLLGRAHDNASSNELQDSLDDLVRTIWEVTGEEPGPQRAEEEGSLLTGVVKGALFSSTQWADWLFGEIEPDFLRFQGVQAVVPDSFEFRPVGSLIALVILFDHLPLGILFLNSAQPGAFGESDLVDVRGIAKAYLQTFQLERLSRIATNYQGLEKQLTIERFSQDPSGGIVKWDFAGVLKDFLKELFDGFSSLNHTVWFPLDQDQGYLGESVGRQRDAKVTSFSYSSLASELAKELSEEERLALQEQLERRPQPPPDSPEVLRWLFLWSQLQAMRDRESPKLLTLEEILDEVLRVRSGKNLGALLPCACFESCVLDHSFPGLRRLLEEASTETSSLNPTGSVLALAVFYDGLPKGLLLLISADEMSFTHRIELQDVRLAVRSFLLPAQLAAREMVVKEYQHLLLERQVGQAFDITREYPGFLDRMAKALPTLNGAFFLPLNSDSLYSRDGIRWSCRDLRLFDSEEHHLLEALGSEMDRVHGQLVEIGRYGPSRKGEREVEELQIRQLYLSCLMDLTLGRHRPEKYALDQLVEGILESSKLSRDHRGLRSHIRALHWPTCDVHTVFPYLHYLFDLRADSKDREAVQALRKYFDGQVSLITVLLLNEGLPYGLVLLTSKLLSSFASQERQDVEAAARVVFQEGQVDYREGVIQSYRWVVSEILSEDSVEEQARRPRESDALSEDEFGNFLAGFMETLLTIYKEHPSPQMVYIPFVGGAFYTATVGEEVQRVRVEELGLLLEEVELLLDRWALETIYELWPEVRGQVWASTADALAAIRQSIDRCLKTSLEAGQRFDKPFWMYREAFLKPLLPGLARHGVPWETWQAGSVLRTAILYDELPSAGILLLSSSIPFRFTEQDRTDIEATTKAYFLTYRSICLKKKAARAARLSGMQQVLLGVTHRLKNDLQPTYNVIKRLRDNRDESPETIGQEVQRLDEGKQIESSAVGIQRVQKKFIMLRSIVTGAGQPKRPRSLNDVADMFKELVYYYEQSNQKAENDDSHDKLELLLEFPQCLTDRYDKLYEKDLVHDLAGTWVDVTDAIEEVLAIYAENTVRAVQEWQERTIYFFFSCLPESPGRIAIVIFDSVVIPPEKLLYINQGEVIPTEVGGGSGTGFYNARNLLDLNQDGEQVVDSSDCWGGTLIRLDMPRFWVEKVLVSRPDVEEALRSTAQNLFQNYRKRYSADALSYSITAEVFPSEPLVLYGGSYRWQEELLNLPFQVFLQRHANRLERAKEEKAAGLPVSMAEYRISVQMRDTESGGLELIYSDSTRGGFFAAWTDHVGKEKRWDQFSRNHNRPSLLGPKGAVGELFLMMRERVARESNIGMDIGTNENGFTTITLRIPSKEVTR